MSSVRVMLDKLELQINTYPLFNMFEFHMADVVFLERVSMFVFKAWVEQLHIKYPSKTFVGFYGSKHPNLSDFSRIGMFAVIEPRPMLDLDNIVHYDSTLFRNYTSNKDMKASHFEPQAAENIANLYLPCCIEKKGLLDKIHSALNEALLNATDWAYDEMNIPKNHQNWWLTGSCNVEKSEMNIMVYDHGSSLPRHFFKTRLQEVNKLKADLDISKDSSDADVINAAIQFGKDEYRSYIIDGAGRGLRQMKNLAAEFKVGKFLIRSGYGSYRRDMENGEFKNEGVEEQAFELPGTLLCWSLEE